MLPLVTNIFIAISIMPVSITFMGNSASAVTSYFSKAEKHPIKKFSKHYTPIVKHTKQHFNFPTLKIGLKLQKSFLKLLKPHQCFSVGDENTKFSVAKSYSIISKEQYSERHYSRELHTDESAKLHCRNISDLLCSHDLRDSIIFWREMKAFLERRGEVRCFGSGINVKKMHRSIISKIDS